MDETLLVEACRSIVVRTTTPMRVVNFVMAYRYSYLITSTVASSSNKMPAMFGIHDSASHGIYSCLLHSAVHCSSEATTSSQRLHGGKSSPESCFIRIRGLITRCATSAATPSHQPHIYIGDMIKCLLQLIKYK